MKGSLRALTREYFVGNQTEQILGWHLGNFEKWAGFTLTALNNPYDPEERLITVLKRTCCFTMGGQKCEGASPLLQLCQSVRRRCAELGEGFLQVSQAVEGNHQAPVCDVHLGATNSLDERSEVTAKGPLFAWIPIQLFHLPVQAEDLLLGEKGSR